MIMSALSGTHEIIELTESYDFESKNRCTGRQNLGKAIKKHNIEDDINKLFEAIEIGSSRRGIINPEWHCRDALHKSAMKRPMRVSPSQASGIGISEPVSLKQALRGLCISQASEMAAVKKRMSRPSASPGVSESGTIKKLIKSTVLDTREAAQPVDEVKGNMVEISTVPERSLLSGPEKAPASMLVSVSEASDREGQRSHRLVDKMLHNAERSHRLVDKMLHNAEQIKIRIEDDTSPFPTNVSCELPEHHGTMESLDSSVSITLETEILELDKRFSIAGESSTTSRGQHMEQTDNFRGKSLSPEFNMQSELMKGSKRGFGLSEQSLRTNNVAKKKIVHKSAFVTKSCSQHNEEAKNDKDCQTRKVIHKTSIFFPEKGCEELEKVPPSLSTNPKCLASSSSLDSSASKHDHVQPTNCNTKSVVVIAEERSRSTEKGEFSQSSKSSIGEYSSTTSYSDESYLSGSSRSGYRPHMSKDLRWEAISIVQKQQGILGMKHLKMLRKIGGGDIGTVYLSELIGTSCLFAVKVMDNEFLLSRKKMHRAQTEKEIMEMLDHPFLPTLYVHFNTKKYSCLVMEYCPGGDLHVLRQKQLTRSFPEKEARFYAAEILLALEYLHMLGVVYRDLKPENILVREDGHIMLSDFDLSLRCAVNPMLLRSSSPIAEPPKKMSSPCSDSSCIDPFCLQPSWQLSCFTPRFLTAAAKTRKLKSELAAQVIPLPQLVVEPVSARSNSFVGTHEYLAPEIIKGEGHGSAVDWWTFGIFLYELLYGKTPFKGSSNEDTISNVVSQCLKFPQCPMVSSHARDLIRRLLKKEPESRFGSIKGAAEIKQHPFFEGLNWALIRCETPPELPRSFDLGKVVPDAVSQGKKSKLPVEFENGSEEVEFEMF